MEGSGMQMEGKWNAVECKEVVLVVNNNSASVARTLTDSKKSENENISRAI